MYSNSELESVFESLPIPLVTTDERGRILQVNQALTELFGYHHDELVGQPVELLMPQRFRPGHSTHFERFAAEPQTRSMGQGRDLWARKKDGSEFEVEVGLTILSAEPARFLASILDISLRKRAAALAQERQNILENSLAEARKFLEEELAERTRLEERQRLGRELHDSLSQSLYGIGLGLRTALAHLDREGDPRAPLDYCLDLTESALVEMRALLFKLRPKSLETVPLADVLANHAQAVTSRTQLPIEFSQQGETEQELNFDQKYALYRIATEALHNCTKHSHAGKVDLVLGYQPERASITIKDDGRGFGDSPRTGHGLATMRERAEVSGGELEIETGAEGTRVFAWIPVNLESGDPEGTENP